MIHPLKSLIKAARDKYNEVGNRMVKIKQILPPLVLLFVGVTFSVWRLEQVGDQQAENMVEQALAIDLQACNTRVETRDSIREILLAIVDELEELAGSPTEGTTAVRTLIEDVYAPLSLLEACPELVSQLPPSLTTPSTTIPITTGDNS